MIVIGVDFVGWAGVLS